MAPGALGNQIFQHQIKSFSTKSCLIVLALVRSPAYDVVFEHTRGKTSTLGRSSHTASRSHCLPPSLCAVQALGTVGNSVQLWLWREQALGFAPEFPEEPLSTTEGPLINSTSDSLEPRVSSPPGSRLPQSSRRPLPCVSTPGTMLQSVVAHPRCLGAPSAADCEFRAPTIRGPWVWLERAYA